MLNNTYVLLNSYLKINVQIKEVTAEKNIAFITKILFYRYFREIPNKILIKENLIKGTHNTVVFSF